MRILVNNLYSHIESMQSEQKSIIHKALSFKVPNFHYMPAYRRGQWDGTKKFLHGSQNRLLTGLVPFVLHLAREHRFPVELVDQRAKRSIVPVWESVAYALLRDYQRPHLSRVLQGELHDTVGQQIPWMRGIIKHPTGSGKTFFAAALILSLRRRTLFVVGRRDLLYQTQSVFEQQLKRRIGIIGDSEYAPQMVTVATVQTLAPRLTEQATLKYLADVDVLIFDEAHHVADGQYHQIAVRCPAYFRFGLSASPLSRGDLGDIMLIANTGEIISELDRQQLERKGWLAKPTVIMRTISDPVMAVRTPYPEVYEQGVVNHQERNDLVVQDAVAAFARGDTTLILVRYKRHGRTLQRLCRERGLRAVYLQGTTGIETRREMLARLSANTEQTFVVIATVIFDEGIDAPDIRCLILAGGGASRIKSIQRVGRGLRPKSDGKNILTVIDFIDRTHKFLLKHSTQRIAAYTQEGFEIKYE